MLHIDYTAATPIHKQIAEQLSAFIATGVLKSGDWLPSVRQVATELSINPNTVQRAYSDLEEKGIIVCVKGKGSFVSPDRTALDTVHDTRISALMQEVVQKAALAGWDKEKTLQKFLKILDKEAAEK